MTSVEISDIRVGNIIAKCKYNIWIYIECVPAKTCHSHNLRIREIIENHPDPSIIIQGGTLSPKQHFHCVANSLIRAPPFSEFSMCLL